MLDIVVISGLAGLATGLGALLVIIFGRPSVKLLSAMLGFAAGIMLAIATLELLPEAVEIGGLSNAIIGFLLGVLIMYSLDLYVPHLNIVKGSNNNNCDDDMQQQDLLKMGYLIFLGIAVHNFAEGMAIGGGMVASPALGMLIALAIAIHNVPEGMAMAVPLRMGGMRTLPLLALICLAGLVTALGAFIGGIVFQTTAAVVGIALGLAAGAMFYIVGDELIPQARRYQHHWANAGLIIGFLGGMLLEM